MPAPSSKCSLQQSTCAAAAWFILISLVIPALLPYRLLECKFYRSSPSEALKTFMCQLIGSSQYNCPFHLNLIISFLNLIISFLNLIISFLYFSFGFYLVFVFEFNNFVFEFNNFVLHLVLVCTYGLRYKKVKVNMSKFKVLI